MAELIVDIKTAIHEGNEAQLYQLLNKIYPKECIDISLESAKAGKLRMLRKSHHIGFPIHEQVLRAAVPYPDCLSYAVRNLSERLSCCKKEEIMESCGLESIRILKEAGWVMPRLLCQKAAKEGRLDILDYAFRNGCLLDATVKYMYGECFSYIVLCIISSVAGLEDRLECLKYVIQHGCELREEFCEEAVLLNDINILRYLRENPYRVCPWNPEQLLLSAEGVIKEYIEYSLFVGAFCGERGYICGKYGCENCSPGLKMKGGRSLSI